jgi:hypothetical protein
VTGTRVTCTDLDSGESEECEITDDYVIVTDGRCYVSHIQVYPKSGTSVLTLKMRAQEPK